MCISLGFLQEDSRLQYSRPEQLPTLFLRVPFFVIRPCTPTSCPYPTATRTHLGPVQDCTRRQHHQRKHHYPDPAPTTGNTRQNNASEHAKREPHKCLPPLTLPSFDTPTPTEPSMGPPTPALPCTHPTRPLSHPKPSQKTSRNSSHRNTNMNQPTDQPTQQHRRPTGRPAASHNRPAGKPPQQTKQSTNQPTNRQTKPHRSTTNHSRDSKVAS